MHTYASQSNVSTNTIGACVDARRGPMGNDPLRAGRNVWLAFEVVGPPGCPVVSRAYNALHDPHAQGWTSRPSVRRLLQRHGLLTDDMNVVCNLKDYNEYRLFLWRQHKDAVELRRQENEALAAERRQMSDANRKHCANIERILKRAACLSRRPRNVSTG